MRTQRFHLAAVASVFAATVIPETAHAQQCTSDNMDNRGCAVIFEGPNEKAQREQAAQNAAAQSGARGPVVDAPRFPGSLRMVDTYFAVAFHPGANDPWAIWKNQKSLQNAEERVLGACNSLMGSGCVLVGSGKNSYVLLGYQKSESAEPRLVEVGIGESQKAAEKNLVEKCEAKGLKCAPLPFFGTMPESDAGGFDFSMTYYPSEDTVRRRSKVK